MAVWRRVPWLAGFAPYALAAVFFTVGSDRIGDQDRSSLTASWPAGTSAIQDEAADDDVVGSIQGGEFGPAYGGQGALALVSFAPGTRPAEVERSGKGDRAALSPQAVIARALARENAAEAAPIRAAYAPEDAHGPALPAVDIAMSLEADPQIPPSPEAEAEIAKAAAEPAVEPPETEGPFGTAWLYFGSTHLNAVPASIERWADGEAPIVVSPVLPAVAVATAPDAGAEAEPEQERRVAVPIPPVRARVVPAALLGLDGRARARAERCLANAVYFEARSEPVRGQIAVAQVVLNRAFSGYYPEDVCGVVYQGANRHLSCQFTFACDGIPDVVTEQEPWRRAQRIARAMLDGKLWLPDVGKATHYHASYVNPYWVRSMRRLRRIGLHTFYRPRRWGDGADAPSWGSPAHAEIAANL
jgi:hypothetical protein